MENSVLEFVQQCRRAESQTMKQRWGNMCNVITTVNKIQTKKNIDDYIIKITLKEYDLLQQKYTSQSILVCPQCKSNKVTYVSKQIRRADESETYFCKCLVCKKQWTFS
tara:strand:+ start:3137 stop:3463 length:327 start_codon:yes stop_codon:yes gene_type:complete